MKEIKFRAWDKENRRWHYLHLNQMWRQQDLEFYNNLSTRGEKLYQYIGLKDKNGKEIYEGDIVKHKNPNKFGIVMFSNFNNQMGNYYGYYIDRIGKIVKGKKESIIDFDITEVIGNIYENPDLLK